MKMKQRSEDMIYNGRGQEEGVLPPTPVGPYSPDIQGEPIFLGSRYCHACRKSIPHLLVRMPDGRKYLACGLCSRRKDISCTNSA